MRVLQRTVSGAATMIMAAALIAALALAAMIVAGFKPEVVQSGSMHPLFDRGTLIFVKPTAASQLRKGDIITIQDPLKAKGVLVTHRIYSIQQAKQGLAFQTKGDANKSPDPWLAKIESTAGLYKYRIPYVGQLSFVVHSKTGYLFLFALPVFLLGLALLRKVWKSPEPAVASG